MRTLSMSGRKGTASMFASTLWLKYEEDSLGFLVPKLPSATITVILSITATLEQVPKQFTPSTVQAYP